MKTEKELTTMYDSMSDYSLEASDMSASKAKKFFEMASASSAYKCKKLKSGNGIKIFKKVGIEDFELQYVYGVDHLDKPLVIKVIDWDGEKEDLEELLSEYVDCYPSLLESNLYQIHICEAFKSKYGHDPRPC